MKLKMVAVDEAGRDDPDTTRELYHGVDLLLHPPPTPGDDDTWMYRSRPYMGPYR